MRPLIFYFTSALPKKLLSVVNMFWSGTAAKFHFYDYCKLIKFGERIFWIALNVVKWSFMFSV